MLIYVCQLKLEDYRDNCQKRCPGSDSKRRRARLGTTRSDTLFPFDRFQSAKRMIRSCQVGSRKIQPQFLIRPLPTSPLFQNFADHIACIYIVGCESIVGCGWRYRILPNLDAQTANPPKTASFLMFRIHDHICFCYGGLAISRCAYANAQ